MTAPEHVTFTGLDAWTDLDRAMSLSSRYCIEWGVLLSPERQGLEPRYPALDVVRRIVDGLPGNMATTAAHLCGDHARAVAEGRDPTIRALIAGAFERYQINTADAGVSAEVVARFAARLGGTGILQCRSGFPDDRQGVEWLFDASGGRGLLPGSWPRPSRVGDAMVGYAGGLGPDTVAEALAVIAPRHDGRRPYWIDMESAIRTDDRLDLDKCETVCRIVYGMP